MGIQSVPASAYPWLVADSPHWATRIGPEVLFFLLVALLVFGSMVLLRRRRLAHLYEEASYLCHGFEDGSADLQHASDYDSVAFRYNVTREMPLSGLTGRWPMLAWANDFAGENMIGPRQEVDRYVADTDWREQPLLEEEALDWTWVDQTGYEQYPASQRRPGTFAPRVSSAAPGPFE